MVNTATHLRFKTVSFVHDSAVYEVHKDDLQQFLTILQEIMIHPPGVTILMDCEVKIGMHLGSLKEWVKDLTTGVWSEKKKKN
jgi:DNA polymerase I-like protein with 3'-5' exonuclease and polymerase domains